VQRGILIPTEEAVLTNMVKITMNTQISGRHVCFNECALLFLNFVCFALKIVFHSVTFDACILVHVREVVLRKLASIDTVLIEPLAMCPV
jgi:hypothetical protein